MGNHSHLDFVSRMIEPETNAWVSDSVVYNILSGTQFLPAVTPKNGSIAVARGLARIDTFTVKNTGNVSAAYTFTASCGSFTSTPCTVSPATKTLGGDSSTKVMVSYT